MPARRVVVTGAGGKSGLKALRLLAAKPELFAASGLARTEASAAAVRKQTGADCSVCDVRSAEAVAEAMRGVETLVVLSSATPKVSKLKMLGFLCQKFCCCNKEAKMGSAFAYPRGGEPEKVDWEGGKLIVDVAKSAGVQHIVYVGSMGGTKPDHFLNKMGDGNILLWKRRAELYLQASGVPYTIIHPGGLLPHFGKKDVPGGERELLVAVDDVMMSNPTSSRCIPREDLASVVVQCVQHPRFCVGRSFDLASNEPGTGTVWDGELETLMGKLEGKNCDYSTPQHPILGN